MRTEWTNGPDTDNGAYGLYPVQCRNVLIEDSVVNGASDAGIYVGQSRNIIVRRNRVEFNVAGIEIENSTDADVYENVATNNTGGILVFNLPGPPVQDGRRTRIFNNQHLREQHAELRRARQQRVGRADGHRRDGARQRRGRDLRQQLHATTTPTHILLISYNTAEFFGQAPPNNPDFDPYSETVFVHDNTFEGGGEDPDPMRSSRSSPLNGGLPLPNIIFDGDDEPGQAGRGRSCPTTLRICVQQPGATFIEPRRRAAASSNVSQDSTRSTTAAHDPPAAGRRRRGATDRDRARARTRRTQTAHRPDRGASRATTSCSRPAATS